MPKPPMHPQHQQQGHAAGSAAAGASKWRQRKSCLERGSDNTSASTSSCQCITASKTTKHPLWALPLAHPLWDATHPLRRVDHPLWLLPADDPLWGTDPQAWRQAGQLASELHQARAALQQADRERGALRADLVHARSAPQQQQQQQQEEEEEEEEADTDMQAAKAASGKLDVVPERVDELAAAREQLQAALADAADLRRQLRAEVAAKVTERAYALDSLRQQLAAAEAAAAAADARSRQLAAERDLMHQQHACATAECQRLRRHFRRHLSEPGEVIAEEGEVEMRAYQLPAAGSPAQEQLAEMGRVLAAAKSENQQLREQLQEANDARTQLRDLSQQQAQQHQQQLAAAEAAAEAHAQQLAAAEARAHLRIADMGQQLASAHAELQQLRAEVLMLRAGAPGSPEPRAANSTELSSALLSSSSASSVSSTCKASGLAPAWSEAPLGAPSDGAGAAGLKAAPPSAPSARSAPTVVLTLSKHSPSPARQPSKPTTGSAVAAWVRSCRKFPKWLARRS